MCLEYSPPVDDSDDSVWAKAIKAPDPDPEISLEWDELNDFRLLRTINRKTLPVCNPGEIRGLSCVSCNADLEHRYTINFKMVKAQFGEGDLRDSVGIPISRHYLFSGIDNLFCNKECAYDYAVRKAEEERSVAPAEHKD